MRQESDNVPVVIRASWRGTEEQERMLAAMLERLHRLRQDEEDTWSWIQRTREAGVPDTVICGRAEISRATLHRKLGPRRD